MANKLYLALLLVILAAGGHIPRPARAAPAPARRGAPRARGGNHTSNWAVLVCTSSYWYNYRHMANSLSIYRTVRRLGIPDSNIILMLADDVACNARNPYPSQVFNDERHNLDVYGQNVEVDYRGYEVTVENFLRVMTGRHDPAVPRAKRMLSDAGSNVLVFITGHGGNEFMKFQDQQELMAGDVADALAQMHQKGRYKELLLMVETCQAATLYSRVKAPNVLAMASSLKGESSYSYLTDTDVGLSLVDRFTYATLEFFEGIDTHSRATLRQLFDTYRFDHMESHFGHSTENFPRPLDQVRVTDFFGHVTKVRQLRGSYPFDGLQPPEAGEGGGGGRDGAGGEGAGGAGGGGAQQRRQGGEAAGGGGSPGRCDAGDTPGGRGTCEWGGAAGADAEGSSGRGADVAGGSAGSGGIGGGTDLSSGGNGEMCPGGGSGGGGGPVKGRLRPARGSAAGESQEGGGGEPLDGLTLGGLAGLVLLVVASSLAWGARNPTG